MHQDGAPLTCIPCSDFDKGNITCTSIAFSLSSLFPAHPYYQRFSSPITSQANAARSETHNLSHVTTPPQRSRIPPQTTRSQTTTVSVRLREEVEAMTTRLKEVRRETLGLDVHKIHLMRPRMHSREKRSCRGRLRRSTCTQGSLTCSCVNVRRLAGPSTATFPRQVEVVGIWHG